MKDEHLIAFAVVALGAFLVGWQISKKKAAQTATAAPAADSGARSAQMTWLLEEWGGMGSGVVQ